MKVLACGECHTKEYAQMKALEAWKAGGRRGVPSITSKYSGWKWQVEEVEEA